jgi:hypothetical protein
MELFTLGIDLGKTTFHVETEEEDETIVAL